MGGDRESKPNKGRSSFLPKMSGKGVFKRVREEDAKPGTVKAISVTQEVPEVGSAVASSSKKYHLKGGSKSLEWYIPGFHIVCYNLAKAFSAWLYCT